MSATTATGRRVVVPLHDLRVAGALMLGAAAVRPFLPGSPGLPCPMRALTGIPCPLCGMTTSVTATVHLDLATALGANPAGVAAVAVAVLLLVLRRVEVVAVPRWLPLVAVTAMWVFELSRFSVI